MDFLPSHRNYLNRPTFPLMTILPRKGLLAIAVVLDVALQTDGRPISAKTLATRHGLPPRHLDQRPHCKAARLHQSGRLGRRRNSAVRWSTLPIELLPLDVHP
jgi:hypothetical protein